MASGFQNNSNMTSNPHTVYVFFLCLDANLVPDDPRDPLSIDFGVKKHKKSTKKTRNPDANMRFSMHFSFCCPSCLSAFLPSSSTAAIPGEYLAKGITRPTKMQGDVHDVWVGAMSRRRRLQYENYCLQCNNIDLQNTGTRRAKGKICFKVPKGS